MRMISGLDDRRDPTASGTHRSGTVDHVPVKSGGAMPDHGHVEDAIQPDAAPEDSWIAREPPLPRSCS